MQPREVLELQTYSPAVHHADDLRRLAAYLRANPDRLVRGVAVYGWLTLLDRVGRNALTTNDADVFGGIPVYAMYGADGTPRAILVDAVTDTFTYLWADDTAAGLEIVARCMRHDRKYTFASLAMDTYEALRPRCVEEPHPADTVKIMWLDAAPPEPSTPLPAGLHLSAITSEADCIAANETWPYRRPGSLQMIETMARLDDLPTVAIRDEAGIPVAWTLTYPFGALGMTYTLPSHRRMGLAEYCLRKLGAQAIKERGFAYAYVTLGNDASEKLLTKLQCRNVGNYKYVVLTPRSECFRSYPD